MVAGFGETLAFVGFIQLGSPKGSARPAPGWARRRLSSVLLGLLRTEYGIVGVTVSAVNRIFYCLLRYLYTTLWAPILAHRFIDTTGLVSVFFMGPVYGLW